MSDLNKLYEAVSSEFEIGDFETFSSKMQTPEDRESFYKAISKNGYDLGPYDEYESRLKKKDQSEISSDESVSSDVESDSTLPTEKTLLEMAESGEIQPPEELTIEEQVELERPEVKKPIEAVKPQLEELKPSEDVQKILESSTGHITDPTEKGMSEKSIMLTEDQFEQKGILSPGKKMLALNQNLFDYNRAFEEGLDGREPSPEELEQYNLGYQAKVNEVAEVLGLEFDENGIPKVSATEKEWYTEALDKNQKVIEGYFKEGSFGKDVATQFAKGAAGLYANTLDLMGWALAFNAIPNYESLADGQRIMEEKFQEQVSTKDMEVVEAIKEKEYGKALGNATLQFTESAPTLISLALGNAAGYGNAALTYMGATEASGRYEELEEVDMSKTAKILNSMLYGMAEALPEKYGTAAVMQMSLSAVKRGVKKQAVRDIVKKGYYSELHKSMAMLSEGTNIAIRGGIDEVSTTMMQNALNGDDVTKGAADAFVVGVFTDALMGAPALGISTIEAARDISTELVSKLPQAMPIDDKMRAGNIVLEKKIIEKEQSELDNSFKGTNKDQVDVLDNQAKLTTLNKDNQFKATEISNKINEELKKDNTSADKLVSLNNELKIIEESAGAKINQTAQKVFDDSMKANTPEEVISAMTEIQISRAESYDKAFGDLTTPINDVMHNDSKVAATDAANKADIRAEQAKVEAESKEADKATPTTPKEVVEPKIEQEQLPEEDKDIKELQNQVAEREKQVAEAKTETLPGTNIPRKVMRHGDIEGHATHVAISKDNAIIESYLESAPDDVKELTFKETAEIADVSKPEVVEQLKTEALKYAWFKKDKDHINNWSPTSENSSSVEYNKLISNAAERLGFDGMTQFDVTDFDAPTAVNVWNLEAFEGVDMTFDQIVDRASERETNPEILYNLFQAEGNVYDDLLPWQQDLADNIRFTPESIKNMLGVDQKEGDVEGWYAKTDGANLEDIATELNNNYEAEGQNLDLTTDDIINFIQNNPIPSKLQDYTDNQSKLAERFYEDLVKKKYGIRSFGRKQLDKNKKVEKEFESFSSQYADNAMDFNTLEAALEENKKEIGIQKYKRLKQHIEDGRSTARKWDEAFESETTTNLQAKDGFVLNERSKKPKKKKAEPRVETPKKKKTPKKDKSTIDDKMDEVKKDLEEERSKPKEAGFLFLGSKKFFGPKKDKKEGKFKSSLFKKWFARERGMPESAYQELVEAEARIKGRQFDIKKSLEDLSTKIEDAYGRNLSETDNEAIQKAIESIGTTKESANAAMDVLEGKLPKEALPAIQEMRGMIDNYSNELMKLELIGVDLQEKIDKNKGYYITRTYKKHTDKDWTWENIPDKIKEDAAQRLFELYPEMSKDEVFGYMRSMLLDKSISTSVVSKGNSIDSIDKSSLKKRSEWLTDNPAIREFLGENKDPFFNYAVSLTKMGEMIERGKMVENIIQHGVKEGWLSKTYSDKDNLIQQLDGLTGYTTQPGFDSLSDFYTTPEIADALMGAFNPQSSNNPLYKAYLTLITATKLAKTAGSVKGIVRNFKSNPINLIANGNWNFVQTGKEVKDRMGTKVKNRDFYRELYYKGVIGDTFTVSELMKNLDQITDKINSFKKNTDGPLLKGAKATKDGMLFLYGMGDDIYKAYRYVSEYTKLYDVYKKTMSDDIALETAKNDAVKILHKTSAYYSQAPLFVQQMRKVPFGNTFISFPYLTISNYLGSLDIAFKEMSKKETAHIGAQRIAGTILAVSALTAKATLNNLKKGQDEEDMEAWRRFLPSFWKNDILEIKNIKDGVAEYSNVTFMDYYGALTKPVLMLERKLVANGTLNSEDLADAAIEFSKNFISYDIVFDRMTSLKSGVDSHTGQRIWYETDEWPDQFKDMAAYMLETIEPGTSTDTRRIIKSFREGGDWESKLKGVISGSQNRSIDPIKSMEKFMLWNYKDGVQNSFKIYKDELRSYNRKVEPNRVDEARLENAKERSVNAVNNIIKEVRLDIEAMQRLGIPDAKDRIYYMMGDVGFNARVKYMVFNGEDYFIEEEAKSQ